MKAQIRVHRAPSQITGRLRRSFAHLIAVAAAAVVWLAASPAFAQLESTTVTPAGDQFQADLVAGTNAVLKLGTITVNCNKSTVRGAVPAAPNNHNNAGPVGGPITTPTFTNGTGTTCPTNLFGAPATIISSGAWTKWIQCIHCSSGSVTGSLIIPQNGVVATANILGNNCRATVAPNGPVTITGTITPGSGTTKPRLTFTNAVVPVSNQNSSSLCPSGNTATISASYEITDITSPSLLISVSN